jgi:hypothetical protein
MVARHAKNVNYEARTTGYLFSALASCTLHDRNRGPDHVGWPNPDESQ